MIDRLSADLKFMQTAIGMHEKRMQVLSTNIANADTPNFKARDFDFGKALKQAVGDAASLSLPNTSLNLTNVRHIEAKATGFHVVDMGYRVPFQASIDGNTVEMDVERTAFAQNTLNGQAAMTAMSGRIKAMLTALQPG